MTNHQRVAVSIVMAALAAVSLAFYLQYAYQAGCAADLKTGASGDFDQAFAYSRKAFRYYLTGLLAGAAAILSLPLGDREARIACAIAFVLAGGVAAWFAGFFMESAGMQACLAP